MADAIPAPGSAEERALVDSALDALGRGHSRVPNRIGLHPAFEATRPPAAKKITANGQLFKRVVNAAWLAHRRAEPINADTILVHDAGLPYERVLEVLDTPLFAQAMEDRGIPLGETDFLTEEQITALAVLSDHSVRRPERKKLQMAGISWVAFQGWLDQPHFRRLYRELQDRTLKMATERGDTVLAQLIDDGNMRAIEYANAMTGRYDPAAREAQQAGSILAMVLSVVQKHVTDEVTLRALAREFEALATKGGLPELEILEAEVVEPPQ